VRPGRDRVLVEAVLLDVDERAVEQLLGVLELEEVVLLHGLGVGLFDLLDRLLVLGVRHHRRAHDDGGPQGNAYPQLGVLHH
jgi:hypothetical protein